MEVEFESLGSNRTRVSNLSFSKYFKKYEVNCGNMLVVLDKA